jgi:hypothetical protein
LVIGDDNDSNSNYLALFDKDNNNILNFAKDKYLLQSSNFNNNNGL